MVSSLGSGHHVPLTKEEAVQQLAGLMLRCGMYVAEGSLLELFEKHWSKVSLLAHAIHDDVKRPETAQEAAAKQLTNQRQS